MERVDDHGYRLSQIAPRLKTANLEERGKLAQPCRASWSEPSTGPYVPPLAARCPGGNESEGLLVRAAACLILAGLLCVGPTGCALFKKNKDGDRPSSAEGGRPPAQFPGSGDP